MKKLPATLLTILISGSAFALPIGNPWEASIMCDGIFREGYYADCRDPSINWCDAWSIRVGFYGDYVFNLHMKVDGNENPTIHDTEIYTNAAYLAFNLWDRIDLFGTLGASHLYITTPRQPFVVVTNNKWFLIETETDFSWSIGLRGTIWECGCFALGGETQYFQTRPDINFVRAEDSDSEYINEILKYSEWQIGIGAAYRINIASCSTALIPYLGVKWNRAWIDMGDFSFIFTRFLDLKKDRNFGYSVGVTLLGCNKGSVTVEGRFVNEKAVYVNGQFRF